MNLKTYGWKAGLLACAVALGLPAQAFAQRDVELTEDLRVLSALVDETVVDFYTRLGTANCLNCHSPGTVTTTPFQWLGEGSFHNALETWHFGFAPDDAQATYIDGLGVIVQLAAPVIPDVPTVDLTTEVQETPTTRWELMRRQLAGDNATATGAQIEIKASLLSREQLIASLVSLLAESGHNFRNLQDTDRVAVSVMFRPFSSTNWQSGSSLLRPPGGTVDLTVQDTVVDQGVPVVSGSGGREGAQSRIAGPAEGSGQLVQGNSLIFGPAATIVETPLAARLTISATKAQLDAVGSGGMTLEQFRDGVVIRLIDPNSAEENEDAAGN